jgi:hypothetical protein
MLPSGQRHWPLSSSSSEQRRVSGGGTVASTGRVGFAGMIDVTVVFVQAVRVCTAGFTSKCFCTPAGNKLPRRSRIAFPHIDARERFSRREICAADAVGQKPMSKEISWVVQGIIREPRQNHHGAPARYALGQGAEVGDLNQCGFLAGDAHTMKIETPFEKPAVWMYQF